MPLDDFDLEKMKKRIIIEMIPAVEIDNNPEDGWILLESGGCILQENGDAIEMEN